MPAPWQQDRANHVVQYSVDHGQVVSQWFAHPLGTCKSTNPLNDLSRLESWHSGPNLGLVHPKSNWSNIENAVDAFQVQIILDLSNGGNNWTTNAISSPRIKCSHQSKENRLQNHHHGQPTHPREKSLKSEMLELGEIDIFPRNCLSLRKLLFVSLIILHEVE